METISIKGDVVTKTITQVETFSKKDLEARLVEIKNTLNDVDKMPDEITMPNDFKFQTKKQLEEEREDINSKLK